MAHPAGALRELVCQWWQQTAGMQAEIFFTPGVADLGRSVAFTVTASAGRRRASWARSSTTTTGADGTIAIFTLYRGLLLMLYERANLAKDANRRQAAQLHRFQPGYPRPVEGGGRRVAPAGPSCRATLRWDPPRSPRSGSSRGTSPIPMVICSRSPGTPSQQNQSDVLAHSPALAGEVLGLFSGELPRKEPVDWPTSIRYLSRSRM